MILAPGSSGLMRGVPPEGVDDAFFSLSIFTFFSLSPLSPSLPLFLFISLYLSLSLYISLSLSYLRTNLKMKSQLMSCFRHFLQKYFTFYLGSYLNIHLKCQRQTIRDCTYLGSLGFMTSNRIYLPAKGKMSISGCSSVFKIIKY
jgi:hypothetical protein